MDPKTLAAGLHPLERSVLAILDKKKPFLELVEQTGLKEIEVMRALQWLTNKKLVNVQEKLSQEVTLTELGKKYLQQGLPEWRIIEKLHSGTQPFETLIADLGFSQNEFAATLGVLRKSGHVEIIQDAQGRKLSLTEQGKKIKKYSLQDVLSLQYPLPLESLNQEQKKDIDELAKRKDIIAISLIKQRIASATLLGEQLIALGLSNMHYAEHLTSEDISSGEWQKKTYRRYDVEAIVPSQSFGRTHFITDAQQYIRSIWLSLGFEEMSGNMVQTAFWDLDALFVPQNHPARAMQDTFFLKDPNKGKLPPKLTIAVKAMHEHGGGIQSKGWNMPWSDEEAKKLLLRTHTTVLSAQTLYKLSEKDLPKKFFTIGRVFRNEAVDWKHLFEFHQIDGIVIGKGMTLSHLIGYLKRFYARMGFADVRVRPGYFPYVEPGVEVEVYHPGKKQYVEFGGAGIFRPEVVIPLFGNNVSVLAWGLGLERVITDYYGITDLRDIYRNDLAQLRSMPKWLLE